MTLPDLIETVENADRAVAEDAARVRQHPVTHALGQLSEVADQPPMFALGALTLAAGLVAGERRVAEAGGRLLASVALATALKSTVKNIVTRTRPYVLAEEGRYESGLQGPVGKHYNSFPSGHTADAVAAARAVARVYPEAAIPAYGAAAAVAAIQIPRCTHYPSDVGAGALVGVAAEAITDLAWPQVAPVLDAALDALRRQRA
ncbi:phosphatase PAP2 family protein [Rubellimicrobium arenae]|uniref:phosphatase PAP2 family protein n=1 Tax=Rubellimicrobium arenae TaxID=2817372 RepID=UPI001B3138F8|nr:phosphatase PAP2 family protein [Rubellimicrobium arenae]